MILKKLFLGAAALATLATSAAAEAGKTDPFDFEPNPAIWRLADDDTTIYLFGTIHVLPKKLKWRSAALNRIVKEADALIVETTETDEEKEDGFDKMFDRMIIAGLQQKPLIERVKPENRDALKLLAKEIEIPLGLLDILPAWMVPFMVFFRSIDGTDISGEYGVETILEAEFNKAKKPILSIEDGDAVFASLSALPQGEQLAMIDDMLAEIREAQVVSLVPSEEAPAPTTTDYADDIGWAKGLHEILAENLTEAELGKSMYRVLLTDRNAAWTEWLIKRLDQPGNILVAVGAGHLTGEDSVQKMLEARGMTVERVH